MTTTHRSEGWVLLMIIGVVCGAPMDEQKIYFPGENPRDQLESRSYGLHSQQTQQSYHNTGQDLGRETAWSQDRIPQDSVGEGVHQFVPERSELPVYGEQNAYSTGYNRNHQSALPHQPVSWPSNPQEVSVERERGNLPGTLSYGASHGPTIQQSLQSQDTYLPSNPAHQSAYSSSTDNGVLHGGKKIKHTWTSHYSTTGTGSLHNEPQHTMHLQDTARQDSIHREPTELGHIYSSVAHQTHNTQDLSSILGESSHQSHELHPNIKQALDSVIKDLGDSQPSRHTVHKISHIKKTSVKNVGKEPSHIQSTSSNDDISLSHLIEQLQILEESPQHVNITWCEEKIKEFLRALRRKQASGIYVNQQVQEETLHQILTHETVESTGSSEGVHEPLIIKATSRPLGGEEISQSHVVSDFISHEQENHAKELQVQNPGQSVDQSQEEPLSNVQPEIITVIPPPVAHLQPEIMSHKYEAPKEAPPFTSDNTNDLKDLELELPEYVPLKHAHSGDIDAFEGNIQRETRPLPQPASGETSLTHSVSTEIQHGAALEDVENTQSTHENEQLSPNTQHNGYITHHQEDNTVYHHQTEIIHPVGNIVSEEKKEEEVEVVPSSHGESGHSGKDVSYELIQSGTEDHHTVHGRPQAPQEGIDNTVESSQEEHLIHSEHVAQPANPEENSEMKVAEENLVHSEHAEQPANPEENSEMKYKAAMNGSHGEHYIHSQQSSTENVQNLHKQQLDYDTLIEELIQLESIPGHQAIDKCEEKIQEFLEILKYQQEQGFGRNQEELERLHKTLIEQAQERSNQLGNAEQSTLSPTSFWRRVQKKIKTTYDSAKDRAKKVMG